MKKIVRHSKVLALLIVVFVLPEFHTTAQEGPPSYIRNAVKAVEELLESEDDVAIERFIDDKMINGTGQKRIHLIEKLRTIRSETKSFRDGISVEAEPDGISMILSGNEGIKKIKIELGSEGISDLNLVKTSNPVALSSDNLGITIDSLESEGMAGVIFIAKNNKTIIKQAFGMANSDLKIPNSLNTIFGTGSRPIDYTVAAIQLLDQQNKIDLDDKLGNYFENVPADKQSISIRNLMSGKSGLPDFFHNETDWDPDLAWIDRKTAEKRIFSQELLFEPSTDQRHSHAAFVLLAALIERVSEQEYYPFIKKNFLDPAGMNRTGEYGMRKNFSIKDFASGSGPAVVGLPNIPPNWGPTSWLIKGSGGMYSTLGDLQKFYEYLRSGDLLDEEHSKIFRQTTVNLDGSDRGFELFSIYSPQGDEVYLFINSTGDHEKMHQFFRALEKFIDD